ncbi:MAG: hypothetical protein H3C28_03985 [Sphingomonadales bacterium]|nr:hypothetical protein [Sphingomonadales bacterium]
MLMPQPPLKIEEQLNRDCFCIAVDPARVWSAVEAAAADCVPWQALAAQRDHLFSPAPIFLGKADFDAMAAIAAAIETAAREPAYQAAVLAWAPAIARHEVATRGVFMGYDFHLTATGPQLIEINTNAGGAFLNALLARAQTACCDQVQALAANDLLTQFEDNVWRMFEAEWRLQGRHGQPAVIAIVDDNPAEQYLFPEFLLAQDFFTHRGVKAVIADPTELGYQNNRLMLGDLAIDLVYNRLVDFSLSGAPAAALRAAYLAGGVVVTPGPHHHALLADKRNLTLLSNPDRVAALGVAPDIRARLATIPRAEMLSAENADALWAARKGLFFKPAAGYAGKAVYRGDKLTRGVFEEIRRGGYIAQAFAAPSQRRVRIGNDEHTQKMDVRLYTYASAPLLAAARLYQGQTTNFRTPGGGFAPVVII